MEKPDLKSQIRREQLIWFLAILLNEREICELLMDADLNHRSGPVVFLLETTAARQFNQCVFQTIVY